MVHKGEALRQLIREKKSTGKKVAEHLGINRTYLSTLFNDPNLKDEYVDKACEFLGVSRQDYFEEVSVSGDSYTDKYITAMERVTSLQAENIELIKENILLKRTVEEYKMRFGELT